MVDPKILIKRFGVKNTCLLCGLLFLSPLSQKKVISSAEKKLIENICEISLNILRGGVKLSNNQKKKLYKHRKLIRKLSNKRGGVNNKKKIVQQGGGAFLVALLAPVLEGIISHLISAKS